MIKGESFTGVFFFFLVFLMGFSGMILYGFVCKFLMFSKWLAWLLYKE